MKKYLCLLLLPLLFLQAPYKSCAASASISLSAECCALYDAENRIMLYGKAADTPHAMASTTKVMTALVAIEEMPLDTVVTVPSEACGVEGSSVYLKENESYTLRSLLYALLLQSANDAAEAIAYAVGGSIEAFTEKMNTRAAALGLTVTHFENPHGLDAEGHVTTARELAIIMCEALKNPDFCEISKTRRFVFCGTNGENPRTLINHNKMLYLYEGATGGKTGFTKRCGRCLVSSAERDGLLLVAVTLDAPSDWADHTALLDYGFSTYESRVIAPAGALRVTVPLFNTAKEATVCNREEIRMVLRRDEETPTARYDLQPFPVAPIEKGGDAGTVTFTRSDGVSVTAELIYPDAHTLPQKEKGWFGKRRNVS